MGVFSGPITVCKLLVRGKPPRGARGRYLEAIHLRRFRPLQPTDDEEERHGWCAAGNILDLDLQDDKIFFGGYVNLGLRLDRWKLPAALLKARYAEAAAAALKKSGRERLTKVEKEGLRATVVAGLKRKVLPTMRLVDMCWDTEAGQVFFWSLSPRMQDRLSALFSQTFGLQLDVVSPYLAAAELGLSSVQLERLVELVPAPFHAGKP